VIDFVAHEQSCYPVVTPKPKSVASNANQHGYASAYPAQVSSIGGSASASASASNSMVQAKKSGNRGVNRYTFKCPYCVDANLSLEELRGHCNQYHILGQKDVVCPVCAAMPWGKK
jgi:hypothetical protein